MQLDPNFGLVIISCSLIAFEIMVIGFFVVGRKRSQVFTKSFLKDNFDEEHRSYTHEDIEKSNGYPDMGNGRYSAKLSYLDWLEFNKAQRVHYNFF
jgi:glutathione S-transferase